MINEFNPPVYECLKCHDKIKSEYEGQFKSCKCGEIAIDSTKYYTRLIGKPEMRKQIE